MLIHNPSKHHTYADTSHLAEHHRNEIYSLAAKKRVCPSYIQLGVRRNQAMGVCLLHKGIQIWSLIMKGSAVGSPSPATFDVYLVLIETSV